MHNTMESAQGEGVGSSKDVRARSSMILVKGSASEYGGSFTQSVVFDGRRKSQDGAGVGVGSYSTKARVSLLNLVAAVGNNATVPK